MRTEKGGSQREMRGHYSWKSEGGQVGTAGVSASVGVSLTSAWLHPSGQPPCLQSPGSFPWFPTSLPKKVTPGRSGGHLFQPTPPRLWGS